jgi:hypothetical protein
MSDPRTTPAEDVPAASGIDEAISRLQAAMPEVKKERTADVTTNTGRNYQYEYADLYDVSNAIFPMLHLHGLAYITRPTINERDRLVLHYRLTHWPSKESIQGELPLVEAKTPQGMGAAISYARRQALCAVTGLAPKGDDTDSADDVPRSAARTRNPRAASTATRRAPAVSDNAPDPNAPEMITQPMLQRAAILWDQAGVSSQERDVRLQYTSALVGREVASGKDLTRREGHNLMNLLDEAVKTDNPRGYIESHVQARQTDQ